MQNSNQVVIIYTETEVFDNFCEELKHLRYETNFISLKI